MRKEIHRWIKGGERYDDFDFDNNDMVDHGYDPDRTPAFLGTDQSDCRNIFDSCASYGDTDPDGIWYYSLAASSVRDVFNRFAGISARKCNLTGSAESYDMMPEKR